MVMATNGGKIGVTCLGVILLTTFVLNTPNSVQSFRLDSLSADHDSQTKSASYFSNDHETVCAKSCSNTDKLIEYQQGQTYSYKVQMTTGLISNKDVNDRRKSSMSKVEIRAIADVSVYQPCEMVLRMRQVQIDGIEDEKEVSAMKAQLERQSTHFAFENGQIGDVCSEHDEEEWTLNIKKSILSSIQMSAKSLDEKSTVMETDINGQCQTEYEPINQVKYGKSDKETTTVMLKTKQLAKCDQRHKINMGLFPRSYGLDQVIRSSMPIINATQECRQKIKDSIVIDAQCCDKQTIWPLNVVIDSDIRVQLIDQQQGLTAPKSNSQMKRENLGWMSSRKQKQGLINGPSESYSLQDVEQLLKQICSKTQNSVQIEVPEMFAQLVHQKQSLSVDDEQKIFQSIQSGSLCNSPKIFDIYFDASSLSGSEGSIQVLIEAFNQQQQQQSENQPEIFSQRYSYLFSMLAFAKNPTYPAAQRLVQFVQTQRQQQQQRQGQQQEYLDQIVLGVTGFIHNLRQYNQDQEQQQHSASVQEIDSLVENFQQYLIGQLEQCIQQVGNDNVNVTNCLALVRGVENVGLNFESNQQQQQTFVQKLIQLVQSSRGTHQQQQYNGNELIDSIRVGIFQSLVDAIDDQGRETMIKEFFVNEQESTVVRVEAYKTVVMSGAKISQLETIKNYIDSVENQFEDLVNYVRSHQANLRTTSDIHRRTVLPLGAPEFKKPNGGLFGVSRNYELSYLNDVYQIGFTTEADVIYGDDEQNQRQQQSSDRSPLAIPQVFAFNLTVPIMGKELQAVQIRVEQSGLEQVLQQSSKNSNEKLTNPLAIVSQLIDVMTKQTGESLKQSAPQFQLLVQVAVDGKTIVLVDQDQLVSFVTGNGQIVQFLREIFSQGQRQVSVDRAFAMIPLDFGASTTTSNGLPIQVRVNSSVVIGFKTEANVNIVDGQNSVVEFSIWPSFVGQLEASVQYSTGSHAKSIQHMSRVYSAPNFNLMASFNGQQGIGLKWMLPEYTLLRYESNFRVNDQSSSNQESFGFHDSLIGSSRDSYGRDFSQKQCTDFTKKPLGVALCYEVSYQNQQQQSQFVTQLSVEKFDQQLNSFEIYLDNPVEYLKWISSGYFGYEDRSSDRYESSALAGQHRQAKRSLKFVFNTPGSQIDREIAFELEVPTFDRESGMLKEARLRIQSPWKQIIAQAVARNQEHERVISVELTVDKRQYFQMELGLELLKRGQKMEYRSKMILASPIMRQPINLAGIWSYQQGRKTALFVSLEDVQQNRHYIKATMTKIGQITSGDLKASAHCQIDLVGVNAKVTGTLERSSRDLKLELNTDYETSSSRQQSARLLVKHQNKSWGKLIKLVNQGSWSSTMAPEYDVQYNHQFTFASNELFEHDLQMGWNNDAEQVKVYQLIKLVGQRGKYDVEYKSILTVKPLKINYEIDAQSSLVGFGVNGQKRYSLVAIGHSREDSEKGKIRAEVSYSQESQQPLKMKMRAAIKSKLIDFIYSDDIEEQQPNNFNGHLLIQLNPTEKYTADYVYSIDKNADQSDQYKHQIDVTLNDAINKRLIGKQRSELRLVPNQMLEVRSRFTNDQDQDVFRGQLNLDHHGPSNCEFEYKPCETKAKINVSPYTLPSFGRVEFQNQDIKHHSNVEYEHEKSLKFDSKTQRNNGENIFSIDSKICPETESHLTIDSDAFSTDCHFDDSSVDDKKSAKIQFRMPESWSHDSRVTYQPKNKRYELDSKTEYQDKTIANIEGKYNNGNEFNVRVQTPKISTGLYADHINNQYDVRFDNEQFNHQSKLDCQPQSVRFESKTNKNGKNIATVTYDCGDDHVHQLKLDCDNLIKAQGECKVQSDEPYAKFGFDYMDAKSPVQHQTEIHANRPETTMNVHSGTFLSGKKLADIKAAIARNPVDRRSYATASIDIPQLVANGEYKQQDDDEHQITFGLDGKTCPEDFKHRTILKIQKRSIWDFKSESKSKKDNSNYLDVEGQYRHEDEEQPSEFDLKLGKIFQTITKFNLFNKLEKSLEMVGDFQDKDGKSYKHETKAKYRPEKESMTIDSKISDEIGNNFATIKSELSKNADKTSFFQLDSDDTKRVPKIKLGINRRMKRAALDIDMDSIQHHSLFQNDESALKVNTITSKNQKNIFNFNTEIHRQPSAKSEVSVQVGPQYGTMMHVYPEQQSGAFSFQTPSVRHNTEIDLNNQIGQASTLRSTTHYRNDLLADIDARLEGIRGENVIKANVPSYLRLDSTLDIGGKRLLFDAQSDAVGRHAMGSMFARNVRPSSSGSGDGKEFHFDLAWDVDRDPRSRVSVDVGAQRQSDQSVVASAQVSYAHNKLVLSTEMTPKNFLSNSARVSLSYQPYNGVDSWQVIYSHVNRVPQVECKLELFLQNQLQYSLRLTSQITDERFVIGFQTTSPQNIDAQINLNVIGVQQGPGQYYLKASLQRAVENQYELVATANQDADYRVFFGKVEIRLPRTESQTIEYRVDLPGRQLFVYLVNPSSGHQLRVDGRLQEEIAQLTFKSDVPYLPQIDGKIRFVPDEEFYSNLNVDNQQLYEVQLKQKGLDSVRSGGLYFLAKFQSIFTPSLEFTVQSSRQQQQGQGLVVTVEGKYNVEKVLYGQLRQVAVSQDGFGQQSMNFDIQGWISRPNGVKLIEAISKILVDGQDQSVIEYILDIEPNRNELETIEPIYVVFNARRKSGQSEKLVGTVKISHGQERRDWIDADLVVESTHQVYGLPVPERMVATVRYVPTSTQATFEVSIMESLNEDAHEERQITLFDGQNVLPQLNNLKIVRKYRNQLLASLDDRKIGFELISNQMGYRNTYEHLMKLYSPQQNGRSVQYRAAYHFVPETLTYFYRNELKSGYGQVQPIYQSTMVFAPILKSSSSYMVAYDVQSPLLQGNGHISSEAFFFGTENERQGFSITLKTTDNDELVFEALARTENEQSNQLIYYGQSNKVTYYNVSLYTGDRTIDTGFNGHVSGSGFTLNFHHQNRLSGRGQHSGSYRFQMSNNNQLEAHVENGDHGYHAKGQYRSKQGVWVLDGVVDEYQLASTNYRQSIRSQKTQSTTRQYKVHVEAKEQCIRANVEEEGQQNSQQFSLCVDEDKSNIVNVAVDSIFNGQKTTDLSIRLDTRQVSNSVILSLKWNPKYQQSFFGQIVDRFTSAYDQTAVIKEISNVVQVLNRKFGSFSQQSVNRYQAFVDELIQVVQDFGIDVNQLREFVNESVIQPVVYTGESVFQYIYDHVSVVDQLNNFVSRFVRTVERQCFNTEACRMVVENVLSISSLEQLVEVFSEKIVNLLQHAHRIVSTSYSGRLIRSVIPSTVFDYIPNFLHQVNYYIVNGYAKMVQGNYPLAEFIENVEHIVHEMMDATHWRSVQWNQVKSSVQKIIQITFSPMRYSTSSRVLVYDPQQGQLQIELYGPAVKHPRYYRTKYNNLTKSLSGGQGYNGGSGLSGYYYNSIGDEYNTNNYHQQSSSTTGSSFW